MPKPETSQAVSQQTRALRWLRERLMGRTALSVAIVMVVGMACNQSTDSGSSGNANDRHCKISALPEDCLGFGGIGGAYFNELYVQTNIWGVLRDTMAANSSEQLFLTDGTDVFMVDNGVASVYLTNAEMTVALGLAPFVRSLDIGPDDNLYIRSAGLIGVSTGPGNIALAMDAGGAGAFRDMSVETPTRIILSDLTQGLVAAEGGPPTLLVAEGAVGGLLGGDMHGIHVDIVNGDLYNLPGSIVEELWVADLADGANPRLVLPDNSIQNSYFHGLGKHLNGGVLVSLGNDIIEVQSDGSFVFLNIVPSIDAVVIGGAGHANTLVNLSLGVSPNGVIYAKSENPGGVDEIFRMTPN